jgi:hypothetical protein
MGIEPCPIDLAVARRMGDIHNRLSIVEYQEFWTAKRLADARAW